MAIWQELHEIQNPNPWRDCLTVAAVSPKGDFVYRHFSRHPDLVDEQIGEVPLRIREGQPYLAPHYARIGWVMYEDLCKGKIPGVAADMPKWTMWQRIIAERAKGKRLPSSALPDEKYLHAEVLRRRSIGGVNTVTDEEILQWAIDAGLPVETSPDAFDEEKTDSSQPKKGKK